MSYWLIGDNPQDEKAATWSHCWQLRHSCSPCRHLLLLLSCPRMVGLGNGTSPVLQPFGDGGDGWKQLQAQRRGSRQPEKEDGFCWEGCTGSIPCPEPLGWVLHLKPLPSPLGLGLGLRMGFEALLCRAGGFDGSWLPPLCKVKRHCLKHLLQYCWSCCWICSRWI